MGSLVRLGANVSLHRRLFVVFVCVVALVAAVGAAHAGPRWRSFGTGSAVGYGSFNMSDVSVGSETRDPNRLRFVVRQSQRRRVNVYWSMNCERGYRSRYRSGDFTRRAPVRKVFRVRGFNPDKCSLWVSASPRRGGGRLVVTLQRR